MTQLTNRIDPSIRETILSRPDIILEDGALMQALIRAGGTARRGKVVDLRGIAMERLEARLDRLEGLHKSVIYAAHENLSGMQQIHKAILSLLDTSTMADLLDCLSARVRDIFRVSEVRLILERPPQACPISADGPLRVAAAGFIDDYLDAARSRRPVQLRRIAEGDPRLYGDRGSDLRSEAAILLDLGTEGGSGLLLLASSDPHQFTPDQGTDLLGFFGAALERMLVQRVQ